MARKKYRGISISTILMFLGGIAILVAMLFPIISMQDKTRINVINADTRLTLAVSEYLIAKDQDEESVKLQLADQQLQSRLTFDKAVPLFKDEEKINLSNNPDAKEKAKTILFQALDEICYYYNFELQVMTNSQTISKFMHLIVNTTNKPNLVNYFRLYSFIDSHSENFTQDTQKKTAFKLWVLVGIVILAFVIIGASIMFTFRHTNVFFLALTLLCLILIVLMFYQTSMTNYGKFDFGSLYAHGTLIFMGGGLLLFISTISGINSDNWLVAIIVYLIVIALVGMLVYFFKDSFGVIWFNTN